MKPAVKAELVSLATAAPGGLLKPESVLDYAQKNPASALHEEFEWDDSVAATEYRTSQARQLIRVFITVLPQTLQHVRGFLSVPTDRANGGGYRRTEDVLKDDALRRQMVEDALKRIENMQTVTAMLPELAPVFGEIGVVIANFRAKASVATNAA